MADFSLTLPAGRRTALVGRSGAGKSTLVNLLMRFIDPDEGAISVDGLALNQLAPADWRARVALVPQQPHLFAGTIADNLRLARPDATAADLAWAAERAGAAEFIAQLPLGDATPVGEQGALLSAGQVQRLAIARAFLKDAPLLILDEPTSALDPVSEETVRQSLEALMAGRTVLVVAHRLNTIISADQIAVLEDGRVVETGSHRELLAGGGAYARLMGSRSASPIQPPPRRVAETACGYEECRTASPYRPGATAAIADRVATARPGEEAPPIAGRQGNRPVHRLLVSLRSHRGPIAASLLLAVLTAVAAIGLLATGAYLIGAAAIGTPILALGVPIALVRLFGIGRGITRYAERLASHRITFSVLTDLRVWCYRKLLPLAPARVLAYHSGDLLTRLIKDVEELQTVYLRVGAPLVVALALSALVVLLFAHFSLLLAAVLLGFLALAGAGIPWLMSALAREPQEQLVAGRAALQAHMIDMLQGLADLLALAGTPACHHSADRLPGAALQASGVGAAPRGCPGSPFRIARCRLRRGGQPRGAAPTPDAPQLAAASRADLSRCDARVNRQRQRLARLAALQELLATLLAGLAMWTVLALTIGLSDLGTLKPLYLALLVLVAIATVTAIQPLGEAFAAFRGAIAAAARVYAVIDAAPAVVDPPHPRPAPATHAITFDRVTFAYQAGAPAALRDVTFHLREGSRVAVVGPSGSGKTTLVNLLVRFWDPASGTIRLGGQDLRDFALDDLRRRIGVVGQRTTIFNDTLRRNLLLARPEATDAELYRVLEQARLIDLVAHSPQGLDRWVGEQGGQLSGGERQRLAIARTLLRDAPVLVLDEPTANLDPATEHELVTELGMVMEGRTTLAITHRLIGLEQMDEILVLDEGRLVEHGTHDHLVAQGGLYRRLLAVQEQVVVMA